MVFALLLIMAAVVWQTLKTQEPNPKKQSEVMVENTSSSSVDGVKVITLEERDEKTNSVSNISYPVLGLDKIDARLETVSKNFLTDYENAVKGLADISVSYGADYIQKFEITPISDQLIIVMLEQYFSEGGGTGSNEVKSLMFKRDTQEELMPAQIFKEEKYLDLLSRLSREKLLADFNKSLADTDFSDSTPLAKEEFIQFSQKMINDGTEPTAKNFANLSFNEAGDLLIHFDKYQAAPGANGLVTVTLPYQEIAPYLSDFFKELFTPKKPLTNIEAVPNSPQKPAPSNEVAIKIPQGKIDCQKQACVALTFDDGPSVHTDQLLDILKEKGAPATFFVLGKSAKYQTQTIKRMAAEGHEIESHTFSHKDLRKLNKDEIAAELNETDQVLEKIIGRGTKFLRPPYGAVSDSVKANAGRPLILWTIDPLDWKKRETESVIKEMSAAKPGMIVLGHDIYATTVAAIPKVIDNLRAKGYQLVTVEELLAGQELKAGHIYRQR